MNKIIQYKEVGHLSTTANLLQVSIYIKDKEGFYINCNLFQAQMAGFTSPEQVIGKTDYDLPWKSLADSIRTNDKEIMESCTQQDLVERALLFDKTEIIMQSIKAPLYDGKEVIGIVGISIDITAQKQAEERELAALAKVADAEEETKRAVMVLAGSIAHDLRTPLSCLQSINLILKKYLPSLLEISRSGTETATPQNNLTPEGRGKWQKMLFDLPQEVEKYITMMHTYIDDNLKAIKRSIEPTLTEEDLIECKSYRGIDNALNSYPLKEEEKELIEWDRNYYFNFLGNPVLFMRIIFNLLSNALYQIHKHGKGKIFITSEEGEEHNIIRFKDTAGGASLEIIERIFEGYQSEKKEGTGVGLAFCKLTMKSFGGDIICHSVEGDYIEFVLTFPKMGKVG